MHSFERILMFLVPTQVKNRFRWRNGSNRIECVWDAALSRIAPKLATQISALDLEFQGTDQRFMIHTKTVLPVSGLFRGYGSAHAPLK